MDKGLIELTMPVNKPDDNGDLRNYSFKVGKFYCNYGEKTVIKIDGLRDDRAYTLEFPYSNYQEGTVKVVKFN